MERGPAQVNLAAATSAVSVSRLLCRLSMMVRPSSKLHFNSGVHRSVAKALFVLIGMDDTADDAMKLIKVKRAVADPDARYIQKRI